MRSWSATGVLRADSPRPRRRGTVQVRIEALILRANAPREVRKRVSVNGLARRVGGLGETVRSVLFRPEEMLLLVGAPSERRRFLDAIVAQRDRGAARDLAELARVLAQRNALLRAIRHEEAAEDELVFWDEQLAVVGGRVMAQRLAVVGEIGTLIGPLHDAVAPESERGEQVRLAYADSLKDAWPERAGGAAAALEDRPALASAWRSLIGSESRGCVRRSCGTAFRWLVRSVTTWWWSSTGAR